MRSMEVLCCVQIACISVGGGLAAAVGVRWACYRRGRRAPCVIASGAGARCVRGARGGAGRAVQVRRTTTNPRRILRHFAAESLATLPRWPGGLRLQAGTQLLHQVRWARGSGLPRWGPQVRARRRLGSRSGSAFSRLRHEDCCAGGLTCACLLRMHTLIPCHVSCCCELKLQRAACAIVAN